MKHEILINKNDDKQIKTIIETCDTFIEDFKFKLEGSLKVMLLNSFIYGDNKITVDLEVLNIEDRNNKILLAFDLNITINNAFVLFRNIENLQKIRDSRINDFFISYEELKNIFYYRYLHFKRVNISKYSYLEKDADLKTKRDAIRFISKIPNVIKELFNLTSIDYTFYYDKKVFFKKSKVSNLDIIIETKEKKIKTEIKNQFIFSITQKLKIKIDKKTYSIAEFSLCEVYDYE